MYCTLHKYAGARTIQKVHFMKKKQEKRSEFCRKMEQPQWPAAKDLSEKLDLLHTHREIWPRILVAW